MEAIKTYLDNVFAAYPKTGEVQKMRRDMLANMEEKYSMLRQSGKSEHEAAYSVIADFGNIQELSEELGLGVPDKKTGDAIHLTWEEAQIYLKKSGESGAYIGVGIWFILTGVSALIAFENAFIMFPLIAVAVAIFIINGNRMSEYDYYAETDIHLDADTREWVEKRRTQFAPRRTFMIAGGVALIIVGAGSLPRFGENSVPIFLQYISFAVLLFVNAGTYSSALDAILNKGDFAQKETNKKIGRIIGTIAAVYWPLVTALGLFLLFTGVENFWLTWAIGGILFGGIAGGISVWFGEKEK